jgi:hypothetical protein
MFISAMRRPRHVDGFGVKTAETKTFTGVTTVILYDGLNEKQTVSEENGSDIPDNI